MHRHIAIQPASSQAQQGAAPFYSQVAPDLGSVQHELQNLAAEDASRTGASSYGNPASFVGPDGVNQFAAHASALGGQEQPEDSAEHVAQGVLRMDEQQPLSPEQSSSRRKPKTSKACDECRRKKIRCDITTDNPTHPCSACARTGSSCQFSRQQLKRGPSKGYIKELATRLSTLESQLGPQAHQMQYAGTPYMMPPGVEAMDEYPIQSQEPPPETATTSSRKRKHSDIYTEPAGYSYNFQQHRYESNQRPISVDSSPPRAPMQPPTQAAPGSRSIWRHGSNELTRRQAVGVPYEQDQREPRDEYVLGWDEAVVDEYYRLVHPTFPLLPHSKLRLRTRLANCPPTLREAFLVALDTAMRDSPTSKLEAVDTTKGARRAAALIAASQFEDTSSRTMSANLIYIQTLILMALESDHHGPATMRGQIGPPRAEWLGRAVGMAMHLKLNALYPKDRFGEGDPDADEKLGRRVWWILFILDRWHASSTAQLLQLPENSASLLLEDVILLGESTYHLARLSYILGHLSAILQQPPTLMARDSAAAPIITTTILGELDRFRESVESLLAGAPNLVHLTYWHVKLMVLRLTPSTTTAELLEPAKRMSKILNSSYTPLTPLNHHFAALAAMTLVELADFEDTRQGAKQGISDILEAHSGKRGFEGRENSTGWDGAIRELLVNAKSHIESRPPGENGGTLRHLADASGAGSGGQGESESASVVSVFDPTLMTRYGFLAALVQENRM